jgi:hypothetical protein
MRTRGKSWPKRRGLSRVPQSTGFTFTTSLPREGGVRDGERRGERARPLQASRRTLALPRNDDVPASQAARPRRPVDSPGQARGLPSALQLQRHPNRSDVRAGSGLLAIAFNLLKGDARNDQALRLILCNPLTPIRSPPDDSQTASSGCRWCLGHGPGRARLCCVRALLAQGESERCGQEESVRGAAAQPVQRRQARQSLRTQEPLRREEEVTSDETGLEAAGGRQRVRLSTSGDSAHGAAPYPPRGLRRR